jgi:hypothetical protein
LELCIYFLSLESKYAVVVEDTPAYWRLVQRFFLHGELGLITKFDKYLVRKQAGGQEVVVVPEIAAVEVGLQKVSGLILIQLSVPSHKFIIIIFTVSYICKFV